MSLSNQDIFTKLLLPNIKGYYIENGSGNGNGCPADSNSSYLEEHGWTGILIDLDEKLIKEAHEKYRKNSLCVHADSLKLNYKELFDKLGTPKVIDYISVDIDPLWNVQDPNVQVMKRFPFGDYDFKILTIEHDLYNLPFGPFQKQSMMEFFKDKKYKMIVENVGLSYDKNKPLEDWYINPEFYSEFQIKGIEDLFYKNMNPNDIILDLAARRK